MDTFCYSNFNWIFFNYYINPNLFKEKLIALITGGTSGIGLAIAQRLAQEGAKVVIVGRNQKKGETALQRLKQINSEVIYLSVDVSKSNEVKQMVHTTASSFGKLDFAFNNAGNAEIKPALTHEFSEENFDNMMGVTIKGVWHCSPFLPVFLFKI